MNTKLGQRLELLMFAKGVGSPGKFAKYLKDNHPSYMVSEDTIRGLIQGKGFQNHTLESVSVGLGVPIGCLITPSLPMVDNYLFGEVYEEKLAAKNQDRSDDIKELTCVKRLYDIDNRMHPSDESGLAEKYGFQITTLSEFIIYFPLCDLRIMADVISRICGCVQDAERYILDQFLRVYDAIPDIPAKRYADYCAAQLRFSDKSVLTQKDEQYQEELNQYRNSDEFKIGREQYRDIVKRNYNLFNNLIVEDILKARLPEIYAEMMIKNI